MRVEREKNAEPVDLTDPQYPYIILNENINNSIKIFFRAKKKDRNSSVEEKKKANPHTVPGQRRKKNS